MLQRDENAGNPAAPNLRGVSQKQLPETPVQLIALTIDDGWQ
ncbi:hypothetical protein QFZ41_003726 [Luteibacter sp. W1I16]